MDNLNNKSCRTCLGPLEIPINLFESSYRNILIVLQRLLSIQIFAEGREFKVCRHCQDKLVWITEFQVVCLKNLEALRNAKDTSIKTESFNSPSQSNDDDDSLPLSIHVQLNLKRGSNLERKVLNERKKIVCKRLKTTVDTKEVDFSLPEDDQEIVDERSLSPFAYSSELDSDYHNNKKRKKLNTNSIRSDIKSDVENQQEHSQCRSILKQFPFSEVMEAIKEVQYYIDMKNIRCIFCNFIGANARSLWLHLRKTHKNVDNWCKNCNIQVKDLQEHKTTIQCHVLTCKFCLKTCTRLTHLTTHLQLHCRSKSTHVSLRSQQFPVKDVLAAIHETFIPVDIKRRQCVLCSFVGEEVGNLNMHMPRAHRAESGSWCMYCNKVTEDLQAHRNADNCYGERCKFCEQAFGKVKFLRIHLRHHCRQELSRQKCKICKVDDCKLPEHQKNHGVKEKCTESLEEKKTGKVKKRPKATVEPKTAITSRKKKLSCCTICSHEVRSLKLHMVHKHNAPDTKKRTNLAKVQSHADKNILCPVCGKVFKTQMGADYHIASHYGDPKFKCANCDKSYYNKYKLKIHERIHSKMKAFVCHICGKGSTLKQAHQKHMETHDVGSVQCTICDKEFYRPGVLKLHMRHHTGENQFHCIPCGKSFHIKSRLRLHMEMHNKDDHTHICTICGKGLKSKDTLRRHSFIHEDNKRYKCNFCPFKSEQAHGLTSHMKQHPEDAPQATKPHKCSLCFRSFSTNALLMCHTENSHKNNSKHFVHTEITFRSKAMRLIFVVIVMRN